MRILSTLAIAILAPSNAFATQTVDVTHSTLASYDVNPGNCTTSKSNGLYGAVITNGVAAIKLKDGTAINVEIDGNFQNPDYDKTTDLACMKARAVFFAFDKVKHLMNALDSILTGQAVFAGGERTYCASESLRFYDASALKLVLEGEYEEVLSPVACP